MDCKEFVKIIPDFLNKDLSYRELKEFCKHAMSCEECKEELTIQFLVTEGIVHLEEGDAFDLYKELKIRMKEADKKVRIYEKHRGLACTIIVLGALLCMAAIGVVILY